nr:MAG TPA: hypothetical protein [Caudoviricetes sp.]
MRENRNFCLNILCFRRKNSSLFRCLAPPDGVY